MNYKNVVLLPTEMWFAAIHLDFWASLCSNMNVFHIRLFSHSSAEGFSGLTVQCYLFLHKYELKCEVLKLEKENPTKKILYLLINLLC